MKIALVVFQTEQIPALRTYLATRAEVEREGLQIIGLGNDVELALTEAGIPCGSAESLRTMVPIERLTYAEEVSENIFNDERMRFLTHREVPYGKIHAHALQRYVGIVLYYADMMRTLVVRDGFEELRVMQSHRIGFTGDILADFLERAVEDSARTVAALHGVKVRLIPAPNLGTLQHQKRLFHTKRELYGFFMSLMNTWVTFRVRPRELRLVISDMWGAIKPYLAELPEAEVVMWERTESKAIGWKNILSHRMRFMHADAYALPAHAAIARTERQKAVAAWEGARPDFELVTLASFDNIPLGGLIERALDYIIREDSKRNIYDIENTYRMLGTLRPQVLLVRASGSIQMHYSLLCYVARALGIPSLEVQHGILYLGPGSIASHMSAEYVATYGELPNEEFAMLGYAKDKLRATGSPRFDVYAKQKGESKEEPTEAVHITYVLSAIDPGLWLDTYETAELMKNLHEATAGLPNVRVSVAVRADSPYTPFVRKAIDDLPEDTRVSISTERAANLMRTSSLVIVGHSTVLLEALLLGKPVIHDATTSLYNDIEKGSIIFRGVPIPVARTADEMGTFVKRYSDASERELLNQVLQQNLAKHYVTDDKASERVATFVRELAKK